MHLARTVRLRSAIVRDLRHRRRPERRTNGAGQEHELREAGAPDRSAAIGAATDRLPREDRHSYPEASDQAGATPQQTNGPAEMGSPQEVRYRCRYVERWNQVPTAPVATTRNHVNAGGFPWNRRPNHKHQLSTTKPSSKRNCSSKRSRSTACAASTRDPLSTATFDSSTKWERSAKVGLRPEPFGALAYHFDTRRLVFLKSPALVDLVDGLADHDSADAAIDAIIAPASDRGREAHVKALASLAEAGVIEPVPAPEIAFVG